MGASICTPFANAGRKEALLAECWGLASAYKQIPSQSLSDEANRFDPYSVVYNPETGAPEIYQQAVLLFGSVVQWASGISAVAS